ncbi:hypothetical protein Q7P37_007027 [Cladosporium fusiforme]
MHSPLSQWTTGIHYACACAVVVVATLATLLTITQHKPTARSSRRRVALSLSSQILIAATYLVEASIVISLHQDAFGYHQAQLAHVFLAALAWSVIAGQKDLAALTLYATGGTTVILEIPLIVLSSLNAGWSLLDITSFSVQLVRIILLLVVTVYGICQRSNDPSSEEDAQPLLHDQEHASVDYGGTTDSARAKDRSLSGKLDDEESDEDDDDDEDDDEDVALIKQRRAEMLKQHGWFGYLKDFKIFTPYIVPRHDRKVQLCYLACVACLIAGRALNVMLPAQLGKVADNLSNREPPYRELAIWLLLSFARYQPGLDLIQALVKIPIENFSYAGLTNAAFNHVMSLSMDFHSERDSAEVIRAIEQGHAITNLLSTLVLEILPTLLDLAVALVYLSHKFNQIVAIALLASTVAFIGAEAVATSWNIGNRRAMAKASRQEAKTILQAVQGWQTVTFFNMFRFERQRFGEAVQTKLSASRRWGNWDALVEAVVEGLFPATFFVLACLVMREISLGRATPGDFVFLMQYWDHLTWPISMLTHNCRYLMSDLVDAERLLHLMQIKPSITSAEKAVSINAEGRIGFENVRFSYEAKQNILHDLSFQVSTGQTLALVGETGAGKSSIMKLLLRLYDVSEGRITLDGHDIRDITLDSLRSAIGVVPQAPLLFNGSILENLRYARLDATESEIQDACRAASIHDKITSFAKGYDTTVGENGVKLSGGEVQRLAIARVFLKNPPILILDEATSAVDSLTEAAVQTALDRLRNGRTTLVIAHRLSTIVKADQILVIHDGRIAEQGSHGELLKLSGRYHRMWLTQTGAGGTS